jgi:hypothetical protein
MLWRHLSAAVLQRAGVRGAHANRKSVPLLRSPLRLTRMS